MPDAIETKPGFTLFLSRSNSVIHNLVPVLVNSGITTALSTNENYKYDTVRQYDT